MAVGSFCSGLYYYDTQTGQPIHNFKSKERISVTAFNGPNILASGSYDGKVTIRDLRTPEPIKVLMGHQSEVCGLAWSPDGKQLASGSDDNCVLLWAPGRSEKASFRFSHKESAVKAIAWDPRRRGVLVTGGGSKDPYV